MAEPALYRLERCGHQTVKRKEDSSSNSFFLPKHNPHPCMDNLTHFGCLKRQAPGFGGARKTIFPGDCWRRRLFWTRSRLAVRFRRRRMGGLAVVSSWNAEALIHLRKHRQGKLAGPSTSIMGPLQTKSYDRTVLLTATSRFQTRNETGRKWWWGSQMIWSLIVVFLFLNILQPCLFRLANWMALVCGA